MADERLNQQEEKKREMIDVGEIGLTGLNRQGGFVYEEFITDLKGQKGMKVYREMKENDSMVGAFLFAIEMMIRQVDWRIQSASDSTQDRDAADFIESCLYDMSSSWDEVLSEIISMLSFGFSLHEIVYKKRMGESEESCYNSKYNDGLIGWRKLPIRAQETIYEWIFDESGGIKGFVQQAPPDYKFRTIPIEKTLLFRPSSHKGNPEGRSVLRNAYRSWYFKKHIENIEGIGIERDMTGIPVAWVPSTLLSSTATDEERASLAEIKRIVTRIKRDEQEGLVFPLAYNDAGKKIFDITLLTTGGKRQFDTNSIISRYDKNIVMTVLADFILLGHEAVGSFALSSSKTHLFSTAITAWLDSISGVFNSYAIPRLIKLNQLPVTEMPELVHGDIETTDLGQLGLYLTRLSNAGVPLFPDSELENYLRRQANLPTIDETDRDRDTDFIPPLVPSGDEPEINVDNLKEDEELADQPTPITGRPRVSKGTEVQSLVFDKRKFDEEDAIEWAKKRDFDTIKEPDETESTIRLRQRDPNDFQPDTFITIQFKPGIKAVIGRLKE